jgi:hypothetical protein
MLQAHTSGGKQALLRLRDVLTSMRWPHMMPMCLQTAQEIHREDDMAREADGRAHGKGKGSDRRGGNRDEANKHSPGRVEERIQLVERLAGVEIVKVSRIDVIARAEVSKVYRVVFGGHEPIQMATLGAARERAKEAPPENPVQAVSAEVKVDEPLQASDKVAEGSAALAFEQEAGVLHEAA